MIRTVTHWPHVSDSENKITSAPASPAFTAFAPPTDPAPSILRTLPGMTPVWSAEPEKNQLAGPGEARCLPSGEALP